MFRCHGSRLFLCTSTEEECMMKVVDKREATDRDGRMTYTAYDTEL